MHLAMRKVHFTEGVQSEALLQVFRNFSVRSGLTWGGGIGIGGGVMPNGFFLYLTGVYIERFLKQRK